MSIKQMSRDEWLERLQAKCEPVGDCIEWQGRMMRGKTPLAYVPRGYLRPELGASNQSARMVFWTLEKGESLPSGFVLRAMCCNDRCVDVGHMRAFNRSELPAEQSRRREFDTPNSRAAAISRARAQSSTKLNAEKAREIRTSSEPSKVLASMYSVSKTTINEVRRGKLWPESANSASVFAWRPAA